MVPGVNARLLIAISLLALENFGESFNSAKKSTFDHRFSDLPNHSVGQALFINRVRGKNDTFPSLQPRIVPSLQIYNKHISNIYRRLLGTLKINLHAKSPNGLHGLVIPVYSVEPLRTRLHAFPKKQQGVLHLNISPKKNTNYDSERYFPIAVNNVEQVERAGYTSIPNAESRRSGINDKSKETSSKYLSNLSDIDYSSDNVKEPSAQDSHINNTDIDVLQRFARSLDIFERRFYNATFTKLSQISPTERRENGVSFVYSPLFVNLALMALSLEVEDDTKAEMDKCLHFFTTDTERATIIREVVASLPTSSQLLTFRWSSRLVLGQGQALHGPAASAIQVKVDRVNGSLPADQLTKALNGMIEEDSGGAMHNTFEEEELSEGLRAALLSVVYFRARWRAAPTLLNGSRPFYDGDAPARTTRMMKINDLMRYADLTEWDAQALEITYATPGLTLVLIVPRGRSLRSLTKRVASMPLSDVTARMKPLRVAATLPLYTLRMTLLLPSKLEAMGITRLVDTNCTAHSDLRLSHAVQRLMFWAEAGRNAFKDDGIEWDKPPDLEVVVDRPYVFFVRWRKFTLMSGNFVL